MNEITPWSMLVDAGLIGMLLAVGVLLRALVKPLQYLMIPASIIAGFLGLLLGPAALGVLPFSPALSQYGSVLIVIVFACMALNTDFDMSRIRGPIATFAGYSVLMYSIQVALGLLIVLVALGPLLGTPDEFGILVFAGWAGGFGTAAAVGQVFTDAGMPEMQSLAFTSATIGTMVGVIGGIAQAKYGASKGYVKEFAGMQAVPHEMRTGLLNIQDEDRPSIGRHTFSGASIDSLGFHVGVVAAIGAGAYGLGQLIGDIWPGLSVPAFSLGFVVGLVVRALFSFGKVHQFLDHESLESISGAATDILIVCGIASIVPSMVTSNALELTILFLFGLVLCLVLGLVVAPRVMTGAWFEKQIFTWGWATGAVATGIALLRIVDPKMRSGTMDEFALAYIPVVPVEIAAVTFVPGLVIAGAAWVVVGIWGAIAVAAVVFLLVLSRNRGNGSDAVPSGRTASATGR